MLWLITLCVFAAGSAGAYAIFQGRMMAAAAAQARLDRIAGNSMNEWGLAPLQLRGNRMSSIAWVEKLLSERRFAHGLELLLIRASWSMRVGEFISTCLGIGVFVYAVFFFVIGQPLIGMFPALIFAYMPLFLLKRAAAKRIARIEKQLAEALIMMANGLRAGFGLMQAIGQAARQTEAPIAGELAQFLRDVQVGSSVEEAITEFGRRLGSYDVDIVVTAVLVQRNVGGNLSEILDGVAHTIRERERIRGEIRTLIAEQKMTGWVIALVPPVVAVLFTLLNKSYMATLVTTTSGRVVLGGAIVMELIGGWMIKKIIAIDV